MGTRILHRVIVGNLPLTVAVGNTVLGTFGPGQPVDFVALTGAPVSDFAVTGIAPEVDSSSATAFPIQLAFEAAQADFAMFPLSNETPVPALDSRAYWLAATLLGAAGVWAARRRQPARR